MTEEQKKTILEALDTLIAMNVLKMLKGPGFLAHYYFREVSKIDDAKKVVKAMEVKDASKD